MALANRPRVLIADEPTTALDVTTQAQILELLDAHRRATVSSRVVLVTHDLGVVAGHADRVVVMYAGRVVEEGTVDDVFASPRPSVHARSARGGPAVTDDAARLTAIPGRAAEPRSRPGGVRVPPAVRVRAGSRADDVPVPRCSRRSPRRVPLADERASGREEL